MTIQTVISQLRDRNMPSPFLVAVPNFFIGDFEKEQLSKWDRPLIYDWLYQRKMESKQTILHISDMKRFISIYGESYHSFLNKIIRL